eukprot:6213018-Pleurochrysis_carterae.AAC.2
MQLACWRIVLHIEFINSVLAQFHDLHCFADPLYSRKQPFLRARRLARGHRATFTAILNSAALDTLAPVNTTFCTVAVPPRLVPWFVDLTFASALGASDDLVSRFTLLHDLQHRWTTQQLTAASASLPRLPSATSEPFSALWASVPQTAR